MKRFGTFVIFLRKYFWIFLIVFAFVLGLLTSSGPDKTLIKQFEKQREAYQQEIEQSNIKIDSLQSLQEWTREMRSADSVAFTKRLQANETEIKGLKSKLNAVNYQNYRAADLDSVRAIILGAR